MTTKTRAHPAQVPDTTSLPRVRDAATGCRACELYADATQTVFGESPARAPIVLVGEQPGDVEDKRNRPFVGPAGKLLDRALGEAGIARSEVYLTNAVKHFRWKSTAQGKRRLHEQPAMSHVTACRPWLAAELHLVRPQVLVAMGATAAASLFGNGFRLTQHRGEAMSWPPISGPFAHDETPVAAVLTTIHPSAVLRAQPQNRDEALAGLVSDLALAASLVAHSGTR